MYGNGGKTLGIFNLCEICMHDWLQPPTTLLISKGPPETESVFERL